jgi:hypothetical protein
MSRACCRRPSLLVRLGCPWRLSAALFLLVAGPASAWASPCGDLSLSFFDDMPATTPYFEPGATSRQITAQMQVSADGSRFMQSPFWGLGIRVLAKGGGQGGVTGESYWATGAKTPMLNIEFQRDGSGRVAREIVRSPPPPDSGSPGEPGRILGWYQYVRDDQGRLRQLIHHFHPGNDGQPLSEDDYVQSRVEIDYGLTGRNPREAVILYGAVGPIAVRFDYDSAGRLVGGSHPGPWPTYFKVTSGACEVVPERLFVILLGAHGGPWHPYEIGRNGIRPAGPR